MELLKRYYSLGLTTKVTQVIGTEKKQVVISLVDRTAKVFDVRNDAQTEFDERKLQTTILEPERFRIANQMYQMIHDIVMAIPGKEDEILQIDDRRHVEKLAHEEKVSWSLRIAIYLEIISPYDVINVEEVLDEEGSLIGERIMPKKSEESEIYD